MRLIDANALIEKAYWHGEHPSVDDLFAEGVDAVDVSDIDNAPTIEAEPVRHGVWEYEPPTINTYGMLKCSKCGWWTLDQSACDVYHYCPGCGARMLEDE